MEQLPTVLTIRRAAMPELPERFAGDDVRFAPEFARLMIERFTHPGECVLDPFAGYGTTLSAAAELGRECVGVELLPQRVEYMRATARPHVCVYCHDARRLCELALPRIDFVLTSPPYMARNDHPEYPFAGYAVTGEDYARYMEDIAGVFRPAARVYAAGRVCRRRSQQHNQRRTVHALAWDVARAIGGVLPLVQEELILDWRERAARTRIRLWV